MSKQFSRETVGAVLKGSSDSTHPYLTLLLGLNNSHDYAGREGAVPGVWLRDTLLVVLSAMPAVGPAAPGYLPAVVQGGGKGLFFVAFVRTSRSLFLNAAADNFQRPKNIDAMVSPHPLCCGGVAAPPKEEHHLPPSFRRHQGEARVVCIKDIVAVAKTSDS